jgi:hypothetical protein
MISCAPDIHSMSPDEWFICNKNPPTVESSPDEILMNVALPSGEKWIKPLSLANLYTTLAQTVQQRANYRIIAGNTAMGIDFMQFNVERCYNQFFWHFRSL